MVETVETGQYFEHVACMACGYVMPPTLLRPHCEKCASPWLGAVYDFDAVAALWKKNPFPGRESSLWRYEELLPVPVSKRVSMHEGWTPLLKADRLGESIGLSNLYLKDERQSPTSSFKDRQAAMAVSALNASGVNEAVLASTGNAAAAYAAFSARAGIKLWVFMTHHATPEKLRETALYGAEVINVKGTYDETKMVAANFAERHGLHLERGAKAIVGKESMKTLAFEIVEQLDWKVPDWYVQAVSGGLGPIGAWKGFKELYQMGIIDKLPRLAIIQSDGCNPMVQAFHKDSEVADPVVPETRITVLATGDPGFGYTYLYRATKESGGTMASVSDEAAFTAMRHLAQREGLSVEPATSVAFAGLEDLTREGVIASDDLVVVNVSGHTFPVEKFILSDQQRITEIAIPSAFTNDGQVREQGLLAALDHLDEKVTTIVVIDDNPRDSRLIRRLLSRHKSYRIFEENAPEGGLRMVQDRLPHMVIMDLSMPGLDGFELLQMLKDDALTRNIPVVVVSGKDLTAEEEAFLAKHAHSVWIKGKYKTFDLVDSIVSYLGDSVDEDGNGSGSDIKALVVEDNPIDLRLIKRLLGEAGVNNIVEAITGEQALELISIQSPDILILDLVLPDMDGREILDYVAGSVLQHEMSVAVLTGISLNSDERNALEEKASYVWEKPEFTLERLRLLVD